MWPSMGSISMPAVEPQVRPSGSSPQFWVTVTFGPSKPSPVMIFPGISCDIAAAGAGAAIGGGVCEAVGVGAVGSLQAASSAPEQAKAVKSRVLDDFMAAPFLLLLGISSDS